MVSVRREEVEEEMETMRSYELKAHLEMVSVRREEVEPREGDLHALVSSTNTSRKLLMLAVCTIAGGEGPHHC